ncbi:hypothetical protein, partial [Maricaulis maris]
MADPFSAAIGAVVTYVGGAFAASAAGTATLAQAATVFAVTTSVNIGVAAIMAPQVGAGGSPTEWAADPDAAIPFVMGKRGVAGKIVHRDTWGSDNRYQSLVTVYSGAGPIKSFGTFRADGEVCSFSGPYGRQTTGTWKDIFWRDLRLGTQPDTALQTPGQLSDPTIGGAPMPQWNSSHRISGKACSMITAAMDAKRERWPADLPKVVQDIEGIFGYDAREDSTYPGGAGSCRADDPTTWVYTRNGAVGALTFALGLRENGQLVGGLGMAPSRIDVAAFVELANVADANGWTMSAAWTSADDKHQTLLAFLQSAGGMYAQNGGLLSCVTRGAPKTSVATISARDTAGPVEISAAASRLSRINTIVPKCVQEAQDWEMVPIDEVTVAAYQTEDRGKRVRGIEYVFVDNSVQASQLAVYDICDSREGITGRIPLKSYMRELKAGDAFTIDEPEFVLDGLKCLVLKRDFDPLTSVVTLTFRSETDSKHPFALGLDPTPPAPPSLTPADPYTFPQPPEADWVATPITIDGENGETQPAVEVAGEVTTPGVRLVEVTYRYRIGDGAGGWQAFTAWTVWGYIDPAEGRAVLEGIPPGAQVETRVAYISQSGVRSTDARALAAVTVSGEIIATGSVNVGVGLGSRPAAAVLADVDAALDGLAQEVIDRIDGDEGLGVSLDEANARLDLARADIDHERRRLSSTLAQMLAGFTGLVSEVEFRADETETAFVQIEGAVVRLGNAEAAIIAENTAWTDAVAAEAAARLLLTARMDVVEGEASDNADAVAAVAADLATEETTRASETGANAGDIVTLDGRMTNAEGDILARATNDRVNEVEVDATEGLRAASRGLDSLTAQVLAGFAGYVAEREVRAAETEAAFVEIEGAVVRLGNAEAAIIAENTAWTDAVAAEAAARLLLAARMDVVEGEASDNADAVAAVAADLATEETTRASETGANAGDIVTLEGRMTNAEGDILTRATNDRVNEVEVDATEGLRAASRGLDSLTAQVLAGFAGYAAEREVRADETEAAFVEIEGAVVRLGNAEAAIIAENTAWTDGVAVNAAAIVALDARQTNAEEDILARATIARVNEVELNAETALSDSEDLIYAAIGDNASGVSVNAAALVDVNGRLEATYGFTLDVGGKINGMQAHSDGETATANFAFDFLVIEGEERFTFDTETGVLGAPGLAVDTIVAETVTARSIVNGQLGTRSAVYLDEFDFVSLASGTVNQESHFHTLTLTTEAIPVKPGSLLEVSIGYEISVESNSYEYFRFKDAISLLVTRSDDTVVEFTPTTWRDSFHIHTATTNTGSGPNVGNPYPIED